MNLPLGIMKRYDKAFIESIEKAKKSQPTGKEAEIFAVVCAMKVVDRFTRKDKQDESKRSD